MTHREMNTNRLEAFSDGVIAIIVTIMVLELRAPAQPTWPALARIAPVFVSYALSFLVVAIMWVNHHHLVHAVRSVSAALLWSNINLLFWMSLVPFATEFLGNNYRQPMAVAFYALDMMLCSFAFCLLRAELIRQSSQDVAMSAYHHAIQRKNMFSMLLYLSAAPLAYISIYASFLIFVLIPALYFLPEKMLASSQ
jgi:uncharacterized membrane protein